MKTRKIYILLTDTGTLLSKLIGWYTRRNLNHVSIALDEQLTEIYSFGRTNSSNPFVGGFVRERLNGDLVRNPHRVTPSSIYSCTVSEEVYERIRVRIRYMLENKDIYKYNLLGLFAIMFNFELNRDNNYFCSQFVAEIMSREGLSLAKKPTSLTTPVDIQASPLLEHIYTGDLRNYQGWVDDDSSLVFAS
ncbi:hypothetical protein [Marinicrinis lubricantis]|uniref:Permuted papain-like amidase YaeF/Yiix C92 family enzyme n=1 Tax=Marinicrinis lubricantis TaxID=2086470 RepID=A0ABW1ILI2_9BACL